MLFKGLWFNSSIQYMTYGENWMLKNEAWPRISHNLTNFILHILIVTMNCAVGTGWLVLFERACAQSFYGVSEYCGAFRTELTALGRVVAPAENG